jgi:hypothetical protein
VQFLLLRLKMYNTGPCHRRVYNIGCVDAVLQTLPLGWDHDHTALLPTTACKAATAKLVVQHRHLNVACRRRGSCTHSIA